MGFLSTGGFPGQAAKAFTDSFLQAFHVSDESRRKWAEHEAVNELRQMQIAKEKADLEAQEAVRQELQRLNTPTPTGPTPTQQYMQREQGLMSAGGTGSAPSAALQYAEATGMAPRLTPEQARTQAIAEAQEGAFQQQYRKVTIEDLIPRLIERDPKNAYHYIASLATYGAKEDSIKAGMEKFFLKQGYDTETARLKAEHQMKVLETKVEAAERLAGVQAGYGRWQKEPKTDKQWVYYTDPKTGKTTTHRVDMEDPADRKWVEDRADNIKTERQTIKETPTPKQGRFGSRLGPRALPGTDLEVPMYDLQTGTWTLPKKK